MTEVTKADRAGQLGKWFAEYADHHKAKACSIEALPGSESWAKVERNLDRARYAYALQDDLATAEADLAALRGEVERLTRERDEMRALAKANNDLAKMQQAQIKEFRQSQLRLMNDLQACKDALAQWEVPQ